MDINLLEIISANWPILLSFFLVAVLYASVGFGGGSSYLALLSFTSFPFVQIRAIALLCNITVVGGGTYLYSQHKLVPWKKVIPLVSFSIPFSFLGGYLQITQTFFFIVLGITLFTAAIVMWSSKYITREKNGTPKTIHLLKNGLMGGGIGFISGMVGIGGGIFLAPILHLIQWDVPKRIAATSSVFILVNSFAGLLGQAKSNELISVLNENYILIALLLLCVFAGGQIGSRISIRTFSPLTLKKTTAVLIAFVGLRILWKYLT